MRSWRVGYRGLLPQEHLDSLSVAERATRYTFDRSLLEGPVTSVAEDGTVVGFVTIGRCRDDGLDDHGEVWAMYVDPERWRRGVGRMLITHAREQLQDNHFERNTLWVLDDNMRARRFYERDGWALDGARRITRIGGTPVAHVRYVHGLA